VLRYTESKSGPETNPECFRAGLLAGSSDRYNAQSGLRNRIGAWIGVKVAVLVAGVLGLASGGCSLSMHLASLQVDPETTATIQRGASPLDPSLDDEDWRRAQAALSLAVDPQGSGQQVNWDNPSTKRKGSFAAAGNMVLIENTVCRPFTATIVHGAQPPREVRHAGQACRVGPGEWAMRNMQPAPAETTAKIRANSLLPVKEPQQALPQPTTSMLEANADQL
jgi:surface antigen